MPETPVVPPASLVNQAKELRSRIPKEAIYVTAGVAMGLFLGLRLAKHMAALGGGVAVPAVPVDSRAPVIPNLPPRDHPCAECEERAKRNHEANHAAMTAPYGSDYPFTPEASPVIGTAEAVMGRELTDDEKIQIAQAAFANGVPGVVLGDAPPIGDLP